MAEVAARVLATGESLVAGNHAQVPSFRVSTATHLALDRAADLLAVMLVAFLHLVADALALEVVDLLHLLDAHALLALGIRVIHLVAGHPSRGLPAYTLLLDHFLASHAFVSVALLDALMPAAGQESLAKCIAHWDRFSAGLPLPA